MFLVIFLSTDVGVKRDRITFDRFSELGPKLAGTKVL